MRDAKVDAAYVLYKAKGTCYSSIKEDEVYLRALYTVNSKDRDPSKLLYNALLRIVTTVRLV